jgi:hypothetical protein
MPLSIETIRSELNSLFRVPPDDPRWSTTSLIDLTLVRHVATDLGLPASQSGVALAFGLLHVSAQRLTPGGPEAPADLWKTVVAAELNFLAAVRAFVAATLIDRESPPIALAILEAAARSSSYSPDALGKLAQAQRERVLGRTLRVLWAWKTHDPAAVEPAQGGWQPLLIQLAHEGVFTRDVIYERRSKFREKLADLLYAGQKEPEEITVSHGANPTVLVEVRDDTDAEARESQGHAADRLSQAEASPVVQAAAKALPTVDGLSVWTDWVNERLQAAAADSGSLTLSDSARRLAQNFALIRLDIEPTAERTPRLTRHNVRVALWRSGLDSDRGHRAAGPLELALRAGLLRQDDGCVEFIHPCVSQLLAAERICDHDYHWASLHPRYARVLRWAAEILARRAEGRRIAEFCVDLDHATTTVSPLGWLDIANCLSVLGQWPGAGKALPILRDILQLLVHPACVRLGRTIAETATRLGLTLSLTPSLAEPDDLISEETFATIRRTVDLAQLTQEASRCESRDETRRASGKAVRALLRQMRAAPSNLLKVQCAAWLQTADLSARMAVVPLAVVKRGSLLRTGLEELASIALDTSTPRITRLLAHSLLACDDHLLHMPRLDADYAPLVCELELATGRRLWWDQREQRWMVVKSGEL